MGRFISVKEAMKKKMDKPLYVILMVLGIIAFFPAFCFIWIMGIMLWINRKIVDIAHKIAHKIVEGKKENR